MTVDRLRDLPGFSIDRVAEAAGADPDVLRLENLDTDLRPPQAALEATRAAHPGRGAAPRRRQGHRHSREG